MNKKLSSRWQKLGHLLSQVSDDFLNQTGNPVLKQSLNSALDLLRPFTLALGLRVSRLRDLSIETVIPAKDRNLDRSGSVLESVLVAAAMESAKLLMDRNLIYGKPELRFFKMESEFHLKAKSDVRCRLNLSELQREALLLDIQRDSRGRIALQAQIFDEAEALVAQISMDLLIEAQTAIDWK
ncbi:MAG: hypothetical protein LW875_07640 [Proteobacteria bacterium]|nr:hypothetical protein [Pseudomonadota bacterium]